MLKVEPNITVWFLDGKQVKNGIITQVFENIVDVVTATPNEAHFLLRKEEVFPSPETLAITMNEVVGEIKIWEEKHNVKS